MKIEKIYPETLMQLMLDVLTTSERFSYVGGVQPFLMTFDDKLYYVYVKNMSSAYFKERPDTTRAQLPRRDDFEEIKNSSTPFIFLGYDRDNDVLICWDFNLVKPRLNEKESVSFYSRRFYQEEVILNQFLSKRLKNGDELILFKRKNSIDFFAKINTFFTGEVMEFSPIEIKGSDSNIEKGKLLKITDKDLIERLIPLVQSRHMPEAMKVASEYYKGRYPEMKLKDWLFLVQNISLEAIDNDIEEEFSMCPSFIRYMIDAGLSDKTITNYVYALGGRITEGIKKYISSEIDNVLSVADIAILRDYCDKLFQETEFIELDKIGKNMYSCALKKYIQFIDERQAILVSCNE